MSSTLEAQSPTAPSPKTTKTSGSSATKVPRRVHVVLQGKGGVGKTTVALFLAQYYQERKTPLLCFDTDPIQESLCEFEGLGAHPVNLLSDSKLDVDSVDAMVTQILKTDADVVIDNGAASFVPMTRYLVDDNIADMIITHGKEVFVHVIMVGGPAAAKTMEGLDAVLSTYTNVQVVVWINEFFGPVEANGKQFVETKFYDAHKDRLKLITLKYQNPQTTGHAIAKMLAAHQTFAEALQGMNPIAAQRVVSFRRSVWDQLDAVLT